MFMGTSRAARDRAVDGPGLRGAPVPAPETDNKAALPPQSKAGDRTDGVGWTTWPRRPLRQPLGPSTCLVHVSTGKRPCAGAEWAREGRWRGK